MLCLFLFDMQTTKLLEEKDDHVEKLQERIQMLEQRFQDQNLVGDDRVQALENEVKRLKVILVSKRDGHIWVYHFMLYLYFKDSKSLLENRINLFLLSYLAFCLSFT